MEQHPSVGDKVVLRDQADREYLSRVENLGVGLLVVVQPHALPDDESFGNGSEMNVLWADTDGLVTVLPAQIMSAHADGPLNLWSLVITGQAFTEQRRRSERVPATGPITIRSATDEEAEPVPGTLVDVSEGGVRCEVEAGAADWFLTGSSEVVAEFGLGGVDFAVPGRVEFLRASSRPAEFEQLIVVFAEPVAEAEALRTQLFAQQVESLEAQDED